MIVGCVFNHVILANEYRLSVTSEKKGNEDLFDLLDTSKLNAHLKEFMPGLTAKVFRTYNASITLDEMVKYFIAYRFYPDLCIRLSTIASMHVLSLLVKYDICSSLIF